MLEEATRLAEIGAIAIAAVGAVVILYSILFKRNILIMAVGAVIAAGALVAPGMLRGQPVAVIMVVERDGEVTVEKRDQVYGGVYTAVDGAALEIDRNRAWGPTATLIINDSRRLVTLTSHLYSDIGAAREPKLWAYVPPRHAQAVPRNINVFGSSKTGPPETMLSTSRVDALLYLGYSDESYVPEGANAREALDRRLETPPRFERLTF